MKSDCSIVIFDDHDFRAQSIILAFESSGLGSRHMHCDPGPDREQLRSFLNGASQVMFVMVLGSGSIRGKALMEILPRLREINPNARLVALVDQFSQAEVEAAIGMELDGVVPTTFSRDLVAAALQFIIAGGRYFPHEGKLVSGETDETHCPNDRAQGVEEICDRGDPRLPVREIEEVDDAPHLTARQLEVLEAVRRGQSNKVIARMLDISEATVKLHVRQLLRKFNASNRTQIAIRGSVAQLG